MCRPSYYKYFVKKNTIGTPILLRSKENLFTGLRNCITSLNMSCTEEGTEERGPRDEKLCDRRQVKEVDTVGERTESRE